MELLTALEDEILKALVDELLKSLVDRVLDALEDEPTETLVQVLHAVVYETIRAFEAAKTL